jgi:hypothetical protein
MFGSGRRFSSVYRDSAHTSENKIKRKDKPFLFYKELRFPSCRIVKQFADEKIPVACMRRYADHRFGDSSAIITHSPAGQTQNKFT